MLLAVPGASYFSAMTGGAVILLKAISPYQA
jgi:hypothetical protein